MSDIWRFAVLGIGSGALYALAGLGIVLIHRGSGVLNFAQGAFGLLGAVVYWELTTDHGQPVGVAMAAGILVSGAAGGLTHYLVMRPLRNAPALSRLIATLGILLIVTSAVDLRIGTDTIRVSNFLPTDPVKVLGASVGTNRLILFGIALGLTVALWAMSRFTTLGRRTSAVAENRRAAAMLGFSPDRVAAANWALGSALAGLVGICLTPIAGLSSLQATSLLIPAMAAALAGRLVSYPATFATGILIGILQSEMSRYSTVTGAVDTVPFAVILVLLIVSGTRFAPRTERRERLSSLGTGRISWKACAVLGAGATALVWLRLSPSWIAALTLTIGVAMLLLSFVVVTGYAGQLSLAQLALAGFGAWSGSRFVDSYDVPFVVVPFLAVLCTVPLGIAVGFPAIRARGANLALATLGFAVALEALIFRNPSLTGQGLGLDIGTPTILGIDVNSITEPERYFTFSLVLFLVAVLAVANVRRGRVGRRLLAVRSNERAAAAMGIEVTAVKLYAFALGSALAALSGVIITFRGHYVTFDAYGAFGSVQTLIMAAVGGIGYLAGPLIGAQLQTGTVAPELVHEVISSIDKWLPLIGGCTLLLLLFQAPDGLAKFNGDQLVAVRAKLASRRPGRRARRPAVVLPPEHVATRLAARTLEVEALDVRYGGVVAVDGLSLEVRSGQIVGLIGPNGAGKSSVIDAVTGFVAASGRITLGGTDISRRRPARRARGGLARSFQSLELFEDLTVLDNLRAASDERDLRSYLVDLVHPSAPPLPDVVVSVIRHFELEPYLDELPSNLSYGKRRLVAIARAVASGPSILLLDEPAAGLDGHERRELGALLRRLAADWGLGILLVEHDVELVMETCDAVTVIEFGRLVASGPPSTVVDDPEVRRAYLGVDVEPGAGPGVEASVASGPGER